MDFYRLLLSAGVAASCRQVMDTVHATEIIPLACPEISYAALRQRDSRNPQPHAPYCNRTAS